ncbi:hypothetical protein Dsin_011728 [Dipteronia sinensis]|uniref:DUF4371 domain-containing protein n=1 Tax=Dipteronia sinensis TaxID=43782 RepID=A0AAE0AH63_9ROSI|nr:hypothetical protein Dsin_011728 [Dipteronia sinensis]
MLLLKETRGYENQFDDVNQQDEVRRAYIDMGPFQPKLESYKPTYDGKQNRQFQYSWFTRFSWLEYSIAKDKVFCFPCFLFDRLDESNQEQMAAILRFVDCNGIIQERFFEVVGVDDTTALTLKKKITVILIQYGLQIADMRGQGYDGASNMCGAWNGLQAIFVNDCPYAYYVHCFAHRLQLALVAASKDVHDV